MRWSVLVMMVAALLAAPLVMAQNGLIADIPFPFITAGKTQVAGEWVLTVLPTSGQHVLALKNTDGRDGVLILANSWYRPAAAQPSLTFNRYGDRYFLSEIRMPGTTGFYIFPDKQEKDLRLAGMKPEQTVTFARLR